MKTPRYDPQKALLVDRPPAGSGWIHELKLDGFRMGVFVADGRARIISRRGIEYTTHYPEIVDAAAALRVESAIFDGEVVVLDDNGLSSFQLLQQVAESRRGLTYFAFDLLMVDGEDLTPLPLEERKKRLKRLLGRRRGVIRYTEHFDDDGEHVFAQACALGAEGIISKRRSGPYRTGDRSSDWQKIKCSRRQEFVVGGFTEPAGSRAGVGSLLIGYYEDGDFRFAGKVGTGVGWNNDFGTKLRRQLDGIEIDEPAFEPAPRGAVASKARWVKPTLVAEIQFGEWTNDGKIRHPSLQGFRRDKKPKEVVREREVRVKGAKKRPSGAVRRDALRRS